jgi:uncharacterized protein Veg|tara:strand:- start:76 stop:309 length:234 start_codon:yes stop_codon:yes gene_type:complete
MYENRKWVIINISDVTDKMIKSSIQTSTDTLRQSLDGSKVILKWDGDTADCFDGITTYSYSEILTELAKSSWSEDVE